MARRGFVQIDGAVVTEAEWDQALTVLTLAMVQRGDKNAAVVAAELTSGPFARAMERTAA